MRIVIVYIFAGAAGQRYVDYSYRFLESYHSNLPGIDHDSIVVLNGLKENPELSCLFSSLPNLCFMEHDNSGYDIGAFQKAARTIPADLMVFFGASTFYIRPGWLRRMVTAYEKHGPAQYGAMGNRGDMHVNVWPHIRTTAFWMEPQLLTQYPIVVSRNEDRHPFEHGRNCFTGWVTKRGLKSWVVTWSGEYEWRNWDIDPEGFSRGQQRNLLAGDHLCEPPYYPRNR